MKKELAEMVSGEKYTEKYMYGIMFVKNIIETYGRQCREEGGRNPVRMIGYRMKSAESIAGKLEKKGYEISCENATRCLNDLAGVRVVCFSEKDIYTLEDFLCKREDVWVVRRKDYIKMPKENGYRSLHLIAEIAYPAEGEKIRVEIQMRTHAMHCWAEEDHRQFYKKLTK